MRLSRPPATLGLLLVALVAAGCLGETTTGSAAPLDPAPHVDGPVGAIHGQVVDDEARPIAGANVVVVGANQSAMSDVDGRFEFRVLAVGDYFLIARAPGHDPRQMGATVVEGESTMVKFILVSIPVPEPRIDTTLGKHALNCRFFLKSPVGYSNLNSKGTCPIATVTTISNNQRDTVAALPGLVGFVIEMQWTPSYSGSRNLELNVSLPYKVGTTGAKSGFSVTGASPLAITVKRADLVDYLLAGPGRLNYNATGGGITYDAEVAPSVTGQAVDTGFAVDQRFEVLRHLVYVVEPSSYDALREY